MSGGTARPIHIIQPNPNIFFHFSAKINGLELELGGSSKGIISSSNNTLESNPLALSALGQGPASSPHARLWLIRLSHNVPNSLTGCSAFWYLGHLSFAVALYMTTLQHVTTHGLGSCFNRTDHFLSSRAHQQLLIVLNVRTWGNLLVITFYMSKCE